MLATFVVTYATAARALEALKRFPDAHRRSIVPTVCRAFARISRAVDMFAAYSSNARRGSALNDPASRLSAFQVSAFPSLLGWAGINGPAAHRAWPGASQARTRAW